MSLPAAEDLLRATGSGNGTHDTNGTSASTGTSTSTSTGTGAAEAHGAARPRLPRRPSGRVRHDEKMTVYVTSEELVELEQARLALRSHHGLAVDRGRVVREAVSLVLADLEARGDESALVRRLTEE